MQGQLGNGQVALTDDGAGREIPTQVLPFCLFTFSSVSSFTF